MTFLTEVLLEEFSFRWGSLSTAWPRDSASPRGASMRLPTVPGPLPPTRR